MSAFGDVDLRRSEVSADGEPGGGAGGARRAWRPAPRRRGRRSDPAGRRTPRTSRRRGYGARACGAVVALGSLHRLDERTGELGLVAEDAWQRRGVGTALLGCLVGHARCSGLDRVVASMSGTAPHVVGMLRRHGTVRTNVYHGCQEAVVLLAGASPFAATCAAAS